MFKSVPSQSQNKEQSQIKRAYLALFGGEGGI